MSIRRFRVGTGRTLTLPLGLVEGASPTRVSCPTVKHAVPNATTKKRDRVCGVHAHEFTLEVARIEDSGCSRFIAQCLRNGDLVDVDAELAAKSAADAAATAAAASADPAPPATHPALMTSALADEAPSKETAP